MQYLTVESKACFAAAVFFCQLVALHLLIWKRLASCQCLLALAACAGIRLLHVPKSDVYEDHGHPAVVIIQSAHLLLDYALLVCLSL